MTIYDVPCEGTNGATATAVLLGVSTVSGTMTFTNVRAKRGATSLAASASSQIIQTISAAGVLDRGYIYLSSLPGVDTTMGAIYYTTSIRGVQWLVTAGGKARLQSQGSGGSLTTQATDTANIPTGQWVRFELYAEAGTSPTTGKARLAIYALDSTTPLYDTGLISGIDTAGSSGLFVQSRQNVNTTFNVDDLGTKTATDAVWGPWLSNTAPTVAVSPLIQSPAAASAFAATATPTDDGSITAYAWSVVAAKSTASPSLTGGTTANVSGTAGAAGSLTTLQCIVTDDGALTSPPAELEIRVPVAGSADAVPLALDGTSKVGTWTKVGAPATDGAVLADASDATYLETGALSATEQSVSLRWQPSAARTTMTKTLRLWTDTGTGNAIVRLYEGATPRKTWTPQAITSTPTDYPFVVDPTTIAAITDFGNLLLVIGFTS